MRHDTEILDKYKSSFPGKEKERYPAFLFPCVLNANAVPPIYAKNLVSDVEIENSKLYNKPPNAWSRGPPNGTVTNSSAHKNTVNITTKNQATNSVTKNTADNAEMQ
eukprot:2830984-Ditylum_brightwellii.AAC.1